MLLEEAACKLRALADTLENLAWEEAELCQEPIFQAETTRSGLDVLVRLTVSVPLPTPTYTLATS